MERKGLKHKQLMAVFTYTTIVLLTLHKQIVSILFKCHLLMNVVILEKFCHYSLNLQPATHKKVKKINSFIYLFSYFSIGDLFYRVINIKCTDKIVGTILSWGYSFVMLLQYIILNL